MMTSIAQGYQEAAWQEGIELGRQEGIQLGIVQGMKEGKEEGIQQGLEKTAKQLLKDGEAIEKIVRWTGLSEEQLKQLTHKKAPILMICASGRHKAYAVLSW